MTLGRRGGLASPEGERSGKYVLELADRVRAFVISVPWSDEVPIEWNVVDALFRAELICGDIERGELVVGNCSRVGDGVSGESERESGCNDWENVGERGEVGESLCVLEPALTSCMNDRRLSLRDVDPLDGTLNPSDWSPEFCLDFCW